MPCQGGMATSCRLCALQSGRRENLIDPQSHSILQMSKCTRSLEVFYTVYLYRYIFLGCLSQLKPVDQIAHFQLVRRMLQAQLNKTCLSFFNFHFLLLNSNANGFHSAQLLYFNWLSFHFRSDLSVNNLADAHPVKQLNTLRTRISTNKATLCELFLFFFPTPPVPAGTEWLHVSPH